jgi:anti-sigma B factor antagonist
MTAAGHDYSVRWANAQAVITMPAEIDAANADQVLAALLTAARPDVPVLVIDMTATTFCDSAGVHAVITAYRHAAQTGTQLRLAVTAVQRIFTVIGAHQLMPIYPALEAALADVSDGQVRVPGVPGVPAAPSLPPAPPAPPAPGFPGQPGPRR